MQNDVRQRRRYVDSIKKKICFPLVVAGAGHRLDDRHWKYFAIWFTLHVADSIADNYEEENDEEISHELWQEACWIVINAYFDEKGLVRQQLDSFDEFIQVWLDSVSVNMFDKHDFNDLFFAFISPDVSSAHCWRFTGNRIASRSTTYIWRNWDSGMYSNYCFGAHGLTMNILFPFLSASFRLEIRSNLFVETDALGERRFAIADDAKRSASTQFDIFSAAVCWHNQNKNRRRPRRRRNAAPEDFHRQNSDHVAVDVLFAEPADGSWFDRIEWMSSRSGWLFHYQWFGESAHRSRKDGNEHSVRV